MNIIKSLLLLGLISVGTVSCSNSDSSNNEQTESHSANHHHPVQLNNGELWDANIETTQGVENMIKIMESYTEMESVSAFTELTASLKQEFAQIFEKCTMTGAAHDQLHNFLIPIKEQFPKLSSSNVTECQESFDQLHAHLKSYHQYFK